MKNYSYIQRFLHDFILSKKLINKSLFELEKIFFLKKKDKDIKNQSHIFITGLPRSGTTSLLNYLFLSNKYASLTYKNMPFVLSPNLSKLYNEKDIPKKERLHGDGIKFDNNSPEAFDEIFFKNDEEFVRNELVNFIQLILIGNNKKKYLSKNNLNYQRIDLISSILPNSIFLIPIREPLQHANSLLNQHLNFIKLQKEDDFIIRYMNYLGHNEFGLNHKSWNIPVNYHDIGKIDYWLEQWYLFYKNIINKYKFHKNCYFIFYEKLININYLKRLLEELKLDNLENIDLNYFKNSNKHKINKKYSKDIYNRATEIFNDFRYLEKDLI